MAAHPTTPTDFPEVHSAYMTYVEQLSTAPTTPTQLINFSNKNQITGVNWSKCSKYFKVLHGDNKPVRKYSEPIPPRKHHKTASGPLLLFANHNLNNNANSKPDFLSASSTTHRRAHSAVDSSALTDNLTLTKIHTKKAPFETFQNVMIDSLLIDVKEEEEIDDDILQKQRQQSNGSKADSKPTVIQTERVLSPRIVITPVTQSDTAQKKVRKHVLLNKPWNKHKSGSWPKNRMKMSYDLKKWLIDNKFDKFIAKLYHYGLETMKDLQVLNTEDIIEDLCGKKHVKMTIIYRRKFIQKVLQLNKKKNDKQNMEHLELFSVAEEKQYSSETQAVEALTRKIHQATKSMKITKQIQSDIDNNVKLTRQQIVDDFDELIKAIALRKKQVLQTLDAQHKMTVDKVQDQYKNICETAKTLLITQQGISQYMKGSAACAERKEDVIDLVESCFTECDKYTPMDYNYVTNAHLKYHQGENAQIEDYGTLMFNDEQLV